jgi:MYXO-CTERM domain-containing protein
MTFVRVLLALALAGAAASTVRAASIDCGSAIGIPGGTATVEVRLTAGEGEAVDGLQNDLRFDDSLLSITPSDCRINPEIGPGSQIDKSLATSVLAGPPTLRNIVIATDNHNPIPDGLLYRCSFSVAAGAPPGAIELENTKLIASDADGNTFPVTGTNCALTIAEPTPTDTPSPIDTPTITPTPTPACTDDSDCPSGEVCVDGDCVTPTPTPTAFCTDDSDCPSGEVCVDNRCVTPTPTPPGFCTDDSDCPSGEVCVDNRCVTPTPTRTPVGECTDDTDCAPGEVCVDSRCVTPTPTPTPVGFCTDDADCPVGEVCVDSSCVTPTPGGGGGGGCSCRIDPDTPVGGAPDVLAFLVPFLLMWLGWRSRRRDVAR